MTSLFQPDLEVHGPHCECVGTMNTAFNRATGWLLAVRCCTHYCPYIINTVEEPKSWCYYGNMSDFTEVLKGLGNQEPVRHGSGYKAWSLGNRMWKVGHSSILLQILKGSNSSYTADDAVSPLLLLSILNTPQLSFATCILTVRKCSCLKNRLTR